MQTYANAQAPGNKAKMKASGVKIKLRAVKPNRRIAQKAHIRATKPHRASGPLVHLDRATQDQEGVTWKKDTKEHWLTSDSA